MFFGQFGMHCEMSVLPVPRVWELVGHCWQPALTSLDYVLALHFRLLSEPCGTEGLRDMTDSPIHPSKLEMSLFFFILEQVFAGQSLIDSGLCPPPHTQQASDAMK